jgi:hypothetical protein
MWEIPVLSLLVPAKLGLRWDSSFTCNIGSSSTCSFHLMDALQPLERYKVHSTRANRHPRDKVQILADFVQGDADTGKGYFVG